MVHDNKHSSIFVMVCFDRQANEPNFDISGLDDSSSNSIPTVEQVLIPDLASGVAIVDLGPT